jgi:hypothetical protein
MVTSDTKPDWSQTRGRGIATLGTDVNVGQGVDEGRSVGYGLAVAVWIIVAVLVATFAAIFVSGASGMVSSAPGVVPGESGAACCKIPLTEDGTMQAAVNKSTMIESIKMRWLKYAFMKLAPFLWRMYEQMQGRIP